MREGKTIGGRWMGPAAFSCDLTDPFAATAGEPLVTFDHRSAPRTLSLSISLSLTHTHTLSLSLCLYLSVSLSIYLSIYISIFTSISFTL